MKKQSVIIIGMIILVIIAIVVITSTRYTTLDNNESAFAVDDTTSITRIFIADKKTNEVLLSRSNNGWVLNNKYTANKKIVELLLATLKKIKVKAPVSIASHDNVVKRLASSSIKVEVYQMVYRINIFDKIKLFQHEKLTKVFYVGGSTQDNLGTYMLMEGADRPYIAYVPSFRGYLSTRFSPIPDDWKSHVVFNKKLSDIKSVQLELGREQENSFRVDIIDGLNSYEITALQTGERIEEYDTLRLLNFLTSFRDLRYETRLNNIRSIIMIDSVTNSPSLYELTLIDQNNDTTFVKMFEKKEATEEESGMDFKFIPIDHDRFYALVNDGEDFVLMQYYSFDKVLMPLSYYKKGE